MKLSDFFYEYIKPLSDNLTPDDQQPLFPSLEAYETPYTEVRACANCCRLISQTKLVWEHDQPFCSLECLAEHEHHIQEHWLD